MVKRAHRELPPPLLFVISSALAWFDGALRVHAHTSVARFGYTTQPCVASKDERGGSDEGTRAPGGPVSGEGVPGPARVLLGEADGCFCRGGMALSFLLGIYFFFFLSGTEGGGAGTTAVLDTVARSRGRGEEWEREVREAPFSFFRHVLRERAATHVPLLPCVRLGVSC